MNTKKIIKEDLEVGDSITDALLQVARAAQALYSEMGNRISPRAFGEFSETAKTAMHDALSRLKRFEDVAR